MCFCISICILLCQCIWDAYLFLILYVIGYLPFCLSDSLYICWSMCANHPFMFLCMLLILVLSMNESDSWHWVHIYRHPVLHVENMTRSTFYPDLYDNAPCVVVHTHIRKLVHASKRVLEEGQLDISLVSLTLFESEI